MIEGNSPVYAALLLKRNGVVQSSWIRPPASEEVLAIMSATFMASADTIAETLGTPIPQTLACETQDLRILAVRTESQMTLMLVAPRSVGEAYLRHLAREIVNRIADTAPDTKNRRALLAQRI